jgi:hypothetical protein
MTCGDDGFGNRGGLFGLPEVNARVRNVLRGFTCTAPTPGTVENCEIHSGAAGYRYSMSFDPECP